MSHAGFKTERRPHRLPPGLPSSVEPSGKEALMIGQRTSVGLGSHARAVVACGLDGQTGELFERRPTRTTTTSRRGADQTNGLARPSAGRLRLPQPATTASYRRGGRWTARRRGGCCCARGDCAGSSGAAAGGTPEITARPTHDRAGSNVHCMSWVVMASAPGSGAGRRRRTTGCLPGVLCVRARSSARSHARGGTVLLHRTAPGQAGVRAVDPRFGAAANQAPGPGAPIQA
jgi:hypothetical protein